MDAREAYETASVGQTKVAACTSSKLDFLNRFQNEVAYLENLENEGRVRLGKPHRESISGLRLVDSVSFTKLR